MSWERTEKEKERLVRLALEQDTEPIAFCYYWETGERVFALFPADTPDNIIIKEIIDRTTPQHRRIK